MPRSMLIKRKRIPDEKRSTPQMNRISSNKTSEHQVSSSPVEAPRASIGCEVERVQRRIGIDFIEQQADTNRTNLAQVASHFMQNYQNQLDGDEQGHDWHEADDQDEDIDSTPSTTDQEPLIAPNSSQMDSISNLLRNQSSSLADQHEMSNAILFLNIFNLMNQQRVQTPQSQSQSTTHQAQPPLQQPLLQSQTTPVSQASSSPPPQIHPRTQVPFQQNSLGLRTQRSIHHQQQSILNQRLVSGQTLIASQAAGGRGAVSNSRNRAIRAANANKRSPANNQRLISQLEVARQQLLEHQELQQAKQQVKRDKHIRKFETSYVDEDEDDDGHEEDHHEAQEMDETCPEEAVCNKPTRGVTSTISNHQLNRNTDAKLLDSLLNASSESSSKRSSSGSGSGDNFVHYCRDCGKSYSTSSNLARHRQTHRAVTDKKAKKCPECAKIYVSMPAFSMHVRTHNQGCICSVCGKSFSRPWLLQGHMRTHTGEKPYACKICHKAFADKSNLRAHIQTHSTTKPFVCDRCHKAFALKSYLCKHVESTCMRASGSQKEPLNLKILSHPRRSCTKSANLMSG